MSKNKIPNIRHLTGCFFNAIKRRITRMACTHPNNMLEGRADGIHCKACGQVLKVVPDKQIIKEEPAPAKPEAAAKKPAAKKGAKK